MQLENWTSSLDSVEKLLGERTLANYIDSSLTLSQPDGLGTEDTH